MHGDSVHIDVLQVEPIEHFAMFFFGRVFRHIDSRLTQEFAALPLSTVVTEFNRYAPKKLVIDDAAIAGTRVGGSFRADRPDAFLRALEVGFNISASPHGNEIILRRSSAH